MSGMIQVTGSQLKKLCYEILRAFGVSERDAEDTAYMMNEADLRGVDSHGCARMQMLTNMIISGKINLAAEFRAIRESENFLYYDGDHGIGFASGAQATYRTIEKARKSGICFTSVTRSGFWGASGSYAAEIAKAGMFGIAASNTGAAIAPFGGVLPVMGNSPWSMAFPGTEKYPFPIMFDMACSEVAFGKIQIAFRKGDKTIPDNWLISSSDRKPITNPQRAIEEVVSKNACFQAFGGVKGYVLCAMVEILSSVVSGSGLPGDNGQSVTITDDPKPENSGLCILAVDISRIRPLEEIAESLDAFLDTIKACPPAEGFNEVLIPGELEAVSRKKRVAGPFEISAQVGEDLLFAAKYCSYVGRDATVKDLFNSVK